MTFDPHSCRLCPRQCKADRTASAGFCRAPDGAVVSRAMLHRFEEPTVSGNDPKRGAGTVFFEGCTMRCVYCQNKAISREVRGEVLDPAGLAKVFCGLRDAGAYNIDLVSPTPYAPYIAEALDILGEGLGIPVVWNTGGYETVGTVREMAKYVGVWLADVKYDSDELSREYSIAPGYPDTAFAALHAMVEASGKPEYYSDGGARLMKSGVIVRHLCLPGHRRDTEAVLRRLRDEFDPDEIVLSLMSQYTPGFAPEKYKNLARRITTFEYDHAVDLAEELGFDGFTQEKESAKRAYTPDFAGDGVDGGEF